MSQKIKTSVEIDGSLKASQIANATTDTDKFLVSDDGAIKYRTSAEILSDLGITLNTASKLQHQVKAGVAINKGQAVYVTSADGTNMIVGLASNASEATSSKTMGLLNATVAANGFADVVTEGLLDGLDTSTATVGNTVWLGTNGNLIYGLANKPSAPSHLVFIGIVTRVNANNGEIFVKVQNGFELDELHDVDLKSTTPSGNDILAYEGAPVNLWKNKSIAAVLGYTPYNASNPSGYTSNVGTVTSVTGSGGYGGLTLSGSVSTSGSLTLGGTPTGIWSIGISGNAATATNADYANAAGYAGNSDTVDNYHASSFAKQAYVNVGYDFNTLSAENSDSAIVYRLESSVSNPPNGSVYNWSLWQQGNSTRGSQIAVGAYGGNEIYFRGANNDSGSYRGWQRVLHDGNYSSYAVPTSRTITINGTSYDLSANRSWTVTASETDTLATVTARGNTTTGDININGKIRVGSFPNSTVNNGEAWIGRAADRSAGTMTVQLGGNLDRKFEVVDYGWTTVNFSVNGYGAAEASGSMRAPIFYDSNNTGYYLDPASTSNLNGLTVGNTITGSVSGSSGSVGGVSASQIVYGSGSSKVSSHSNANEWRNSGFYENDGGGSNWPSATWYNSINVRHSNQGNYHGFQVAMSYYDNNLWFRSYQGSGTFQGWQRAAVARGEGTNYIDYSRYVYNNGAYSGSGWVEPSDLGVRYALNSTNAGNADTVDGFHGDTFFRNLGFGSGYPSWNANTIDESRSGFTYANGAPHNGCIAHFGASGYGIQLNGNYGGDTFAMRSRNGDNGTWRPWKTLYTDYNMDAPNKSGTSYYQTNTWMQFNGTYGLYWPSAYGAHFHPNDATSYTQFRLQGNKNGYGGIYDSYSGVNGIMYDGAGNGGVYREANGRWFWYHHIGNNCTGISTSATSSSYRAYIGGSLYAEGDIVAYSDRRKKENIVTVDRALDKVNKLRGVYYNRIDDDTKKRQVGVIAQEIQEILPEVVTYAEDVDEYGVSYGNITGLLIEAIKEQQTQIEELKELVKILINK